MLLWLWKPTFLGFVIHELPISALGAITWLVSKLKDLIIIWAKEVHNLLYDLWLELSWQNHTFSFLSFLFCSKIISSLTNKWKHCGILQNLKLNSVKVDLIHMHHWTRLSSTLVYMSWMYFVVAELNHFIYT